MSDYKKKIVDGVLNDPMYKLVADSLPSDQKDKIKDILETFVEQFSMNLFKSFSVAAKHNNDNNNQASKNNVSGSIIIKDNGWFW